ncbi:hypothetical protein DVH05_010332 [Phytophthora capsici]|nr:hypothetical protein DVH05_010332 [Phytophthora capsici]
MLANELCMVHSVSYWRERCIADSSTEEEESTPPNLQRAGTVDGHDGYSSTETGPLEDSPQHGQQKQKTEESPLIPEDVGTPTTPPYARPPSSPTTSSPVLLETPPMPLPCHRLRTPLREHRSSLKENRTAAHSYTIAVVNQSHRP